MSNFLNPENSFLKRVISIIEANLADEGFSVEDLAGEMSMSRSSLLRKVKEKSDVSVSVFIRKVRLHHAKEMLKDETLNASEVSYKVGFNSVSYFTKCFREEFGYTPGDKKRRESHDSTTTANESGKRKSKWLVPAIILTIVVIVSLYWIPGQNDQLDSNTPLEKSIAVLPFKNDSNDSSNVYVINGLMDAILDNLQKIDDLDVTSRTTTEKYRQASKTIPELFKELEVNYFVEGSGQKIGDKILLSIQLIDATKDKRIWSRRFERETKDIFDLQSEVAKAIAGEIQATITPEEKRQIDKVPTENMVAYDHYLKGLEVRNATTNEELLEAIEHFKEAIEEDENFANAYAFVAICYYYLDIFLAEKEFGHEINTYADKAMLLDPELPESIIAKALFYLQDGQYEFAAEHLEKALKHAPGSEWVHNLLTDIYTTYIPNTSKYLAHAIQGIRVAVADQDSITASFTYLHLSNALAQSGFIKESEKYVLRSLDYNPHNLYSQYLYVYIRQAQNFDMARAKEELKLILEKDTTRLDVIQEIAKVCYTMRDYEEAWEYYEDFVRYRSMWGLSIYPGEDLKIAYVLKQLGRDEEAQKYMESYQIYIDNDESIYLDLSIAAYNAVEGDISKGIFHLKEFTKQNDYLYWVILFLDKDPILLELSSDPSYDAIIKEITENFWQQHRQTRKMLEEQGII